MDSLSIPGLFVTGTSTAVGKTFVVRALAASASRAGRRVAALKPIETGIASAPLDALALARACGHPELAEAPGLYRASLPLAPYAVALETDSAPPAVPALVHRIRQLAAGVNADLLLVEGAGGLLVPIDPQRTIADLAVELGLPLLLVARDELGVLSSVLTTAESAAARNLRIAAVVLSTHHAQPPLADDPSPRTNRRILHERLGVPIIAFPPCADDDRLLAVAAERSGLLDLLR